MKTTPYLLAALAAATVATAEARKVKPPIDPQPAGNHVQIALLLDTSNSMDGLIDQAKTQLWKVVNTFIEARRDGEAPFVEVALYEYGNNNQPAGNQYIRMVQPLSRDLDEISRQLFSLKTNGGEEYCGAVIQRALSDLTWDDNPKTYKAVFIAGNEPFTQGPVDPRSVCRHALSKKVVINTIHCGPRGEGINGDWHDGAAIGGGEFMVIDQDRAVTHIPAPQDARIQKLGEELNGTYMAYGRHAQEGRQKQEFADRDAAANAAAGSFVERSVAKASVNYHNDSWDLVDAVRADKLDLAKVDAKDLPADMQGLAAGELKIRIDAAAKKRTGIQNEIQELNKQREAHVAAERAKLAKGGAKTLDEVLVETTRAQASKLGYSFGN
jgi:hypothetical protein